MVLLLRHGETALNVSGALRGLVDVPLSAQGRIEAQRLAERIAAEYSLSAVYSSPLRRARETAEAVAAPAGLTVEIDDRFRDVDYGAWAGKPAASMSAAEQAELSRWQRNPEIPLPGAEDPAEARRRALAGLAARTETASGCIAIVTHDVILQLMLCSILGLGLRTYRGIAQHTATLNELERTADGWRVRLLDSTWHLPGAPRAGNGVRRITTQGG
jgi:broad specificity phosphatase PhoE